MGANPRHPYTLPAAALGRQGCVSARPQRLTLAPSAAHLCLFLHTWLSSLHSYPIASFLSPPAALHVRIFFSMGSRPFPQSSLLPGEPSQPPWRTPFSPICQFTYCTYIHQASPHWQVSDGDVMPLHVQPISKDRHYSLAHSGIPSIISF
ncbi:hypothetical protein LY76DRAFT_360483 [Colletotrichum caudatum]|nr:hypothetical protein LY76DRAFT_360483 [Colletotrichum caudatum]